MRLEIALGKSHYQGLVGMRVEHTPRIGRAPVDNLDQKIAFLDCSPGPAHPFSIDRVARLPETRRIEQPDRNPCDDDVPLDDVTCRTSLRCDDCPISTE